MAGLLLEDGTLRLTEDGSVRVLEEDVASTVGTAQWASRNLVRLANSRGFTRLYGSRALSR